MYSKIVTNIFMGLKIWCQVGEWENFFFKLPYVGVFLYYHTESTIPHTENKIPLQDFFHKIKVPHR